MDIETMAFSRCCVNNTITKNNFENVCEWGVSGCLGVSSGRF